MTSSIRGIKETTPRVILEVDTVSGMPLRFPVKNNKIQTPGDALYGREKLIDEQAEEDTHSQSALLTIAASVKPGRNRARYLLLHDEKNVLATAPISIFLWSEKDRVVVVDIDGTITKSNLRGVFDTILTVQYQHCHAGVCKFFSSLLHLKRKLEQQTHLVYLSSRPLKLANTTKKFLSELRQHEETQLPHGPLIGYPGTLTQVLMMELITRSVNEFKCNALRNQVVRPFTAVGVTENVLLAGFGNSHMDLHAYQMAGCDKIYLVDRKSKICAFSPVRRRDSSSLIRGSLFEGYSDSSLLAHVSQ